MTTTLIRALALVLAAAPAAAQEFGGKVPGLIHGDPGWFMPSQTAPAYGAPIYADPAWGYVDPYAMAAAQWASTYGAPIFAPQTGYPAYDSHDAQMIAGYSAWSSDLSAQTMADSFAGASDRAAAFTSLY